MTGSPVPGSYGWRWMFVFGGVPALFIGFIRAAREHKAGGRLLGAVPVASSIGQ